MKISEMPKFVFSHRLVLNTVICSLLAMAMLVLELVLMNRSNIIAVVFDVVIPFSACVTFGCYSITMADNRPFLLICPPMAYFVSTLITQLITLEIGEQIHLSQEFLKSIPFLVLFSLAETIPVIFYCISVCTGLIKKISMYSLNIGCLVIVLTCAAMTVLGVFFEIMFYSKLKQTFATVTGFLAVFFIYIGMIEQLKIINSLRR